jgi:hypothetical protein
MLILDYAATAVIRVTTSSTADIEAEVSGIDHTISGDVFLGFQQHTAIASAATTTIGTGPASGHVRNYKHISLRNKHASTANTLTLESYNGTLAVQLAVVTLAAGEMMVIDEKGVLFVYDTNGGVKMGATAASDTVPGLIEIATQAEMEAASSTAVAVTPGRLKYHPGVAKALMFTTGTATPVASTPPTYNCTLTDTGVGQLTVNFTVAFSATTAYTVQVNVEIISTTLTAAGNCLQGYMRFGGQGAAGSCQVNCCDRTATTNVIRDPISWHVAAYGDQA